MISGSTGQVASNISDSGSVVVGGGVVGGYIKSKKHSKCKRNAHGVTSY